MSQLLTPSDYQRKAWKNGGGELLDIIVRPAGADLNAFDWRASIALVQRGGPFSHFPGIDRTIVLLEGAGMHLEGEHWSANMTRAFEPVHFPGELAVNCTLTDGPTRDFNLMLRRGVVRGDMQVLRRETLDLDGAGALLCYVARGGVEVSVAGDEPRRIDDDCTWVRELELSSQENGVQMRPMTNDTVALVARIERVPS